MSGPGVYARIHRMEESGIIQGYTVQVDPRARQGNVVAFVRVTTRAQANEHDLFESLALQDIRILECHDVAGEDSYLLKVQCKSLEELRELIASVRAVPQVTRTLASVVLTTIKETNKRSRK